MDALTEILWDEFKEKNPWVHKYIYTSSVVRYVLVILLFVSGILAIFTSWGWKFLLTDAVVLGFTVFQYVVVSRFILLKFKNWLDG